MEIALFTDNTALLRARVKALKLRQTNASRQRQKSDSEQEPLIPSNQEASESENEKSAATSVNFRLYAAHARQICQHIRELADLVLERRKSYLLTRVNVYGHDNFMTDEDRRQFDSDTDLAMKQCSKLVRNLEFQLDNDSTLRSDDEYPHLKAVTLMLNVYLKNVCKIVSELRAVHLKKTQFLNKICRLGNLVNMCGSKLDNQRIEGLEIRSRQSSDSSSVNMPRVKNVQFEDNTKILDVDYQQEDEAAAELEQLDPAEQQQLSMENQHLLERFIQRNSEIEQIEGQFAELQRLQQTFVEKVIEQEKDIEIIHEKTVHTLDNLDQANEFIREAIKNSASRRVIALFCLIVLTFTLLFLDWYNP